MGKIEIVKFGPTEDQIEFRKALAHRVHPIVVAELIHGKTEHSEADFRAGARLTLRYVDALIEELEE